MEGETSVVVPIPMDLGKPESDEEYDDDQGESLPDTDDSSRERESVIASGSDDDASSGTLTHSVHSGILQTTINDCSCVAPYIILHISYQICLFKQ